MDVLASAVVVVAMLAFALLIAVVGARTLGRARRRGKHVPLLPWWYLGGQPDVPGPAEPDPHGRPRER